MNQRVYSQKQIAYLAISIWFLINLLQAIFTELHSDEVYYWTYSWDLRWGYWDNAPLIGLYTFLGDTLFPYTEIGVRLFSVLSGTLAVYILWLCTDKKDAVLFFALLFGMALVHAGGFMAAPDSPLALAGILLLYAYKQYILKTDWNQAVILGLSAALVMYSKYQGAMLIGMLAISRPKQLMQKQFWFSIIVFLIAFSPGLYAMYQLDFSTFQYHLSEKNPESWKWNWTTDFILGQFLSAGPFIGFLIIPILFIYKPTDAFLRSAKSTSIGIYIFLLLLSFKVNVLGNWAASALFPLLLVGYDAIRQRMRFRKWALRLSLAGLVCIMGFRVYIISELPLPKTISFHFRNWENWANDMKVIAGDKPVVFFNTFQLPSRYAFYNKTQSVYTLNNFDYHPTQFDFTNIEDSLQGQEVVFVSKYNYGSNDSVIDPEHGNFYCFPISSFCSYQKAVIDIPNSIIELGIGEKMDVILTIYTDNIDVKGYNKCSDYSFYPAYNIRAGNNYLERYIYKDKQINLSQSDPITFSVEIVAPEMPGNYDILFSLATDWYIPFFGTNGKWIKLEVTN